MSSMARSPERDWFIVGRWQEFEGEARANLLRIIGIAAFYIIELYTYHTLQVERATHQSVTALAVAWMMAAMAILICLRRQIFPASLKFISTACDLVLLTGMLTIVDGPRSALVAGYFLIIVLATLRFQLPLVWFSTGGALVGYVVLLGYVDYFSNRDIDVPRHHQLIMIVSLLLTGVILGQVIRRVRNIAQEYAERVGRGLVRE